MEVSDVLNEDLKVKLTGLGLTEDQIKALEQEGLTDESEIKLLSADQIKISAGCGIITAAKVVEAFKPVILTKAAPANTGAQQVSFDILPQVPDDLSFVGLLKVGGELKVGTTEVIAAIRAALADKIDLYDLPKLLMARMEEFAEQQENPCPKEFYEMQKLVTKRNYSEIFAALDIDTASVTQAKKDKLLERLGTNLWPALFDFHQQVVAWVKNYQMESNNPAAFVNLINSIATGTQSFEMIVPDTSIIHDAAESVIDKINRLFAGTGIIIARALALDANQIKTVLENPVLPSQIGAASHDQMLKMLDLNVSADYVRLEFNITRYALAIMEFNKMGSGPSEISYLSALNQLGNQILWDKISATSTAAVSKTDRKKVAGGDEKVSHY